MKRSILLLRAISNAATALKKAASWKGSLRPVDIKNDDFLYELICYFKVALAAKQGFTLSIAGETQPGSKGKLAARWPRKPGDKANFSFLRLKKNGKEIFQLCPGINIQDRFGKYRAPDINLLLGGGGAVPTFQDLAGLWDAKYLSDASSRLPDTQVSDFKHTFSKLGAPSIPAEWVSEIQRPEFRQSGLLTNGKRSTEPDASLKEDGILETEYYPDNPVTRP